MAEQDKNTPKEREKRLLEQMLAIKKETGAIDGRVSGYIDRDRQESYTMDLFTNQANQSQESSKQEYEKNINSWIESDSSRARLVIVEAEPDNLKQLAKVTFNASPLERVLIVGLTPDMKQDLTSELKELWKVKLEKSEENKAQFQQLFKGNDNWEDTLEQRTLEDLLGPHLYKDDLDISPKIMNEQFPHFDVNTEEILCFGKNDELAENLGELGQSIQTGVPIFSVKSKPFEELEGAGLWRSCCKDKDEFIKTIALGKSAPDLIGKKTETDKEKSTKIVYENITIAKNLQELFRLDTLKGVMIHQEFSEQEKNDVKQEDIDYLKKILFEEALYPANTSPKAITKIISKSTSKLGALKATKVASALKWNLVDRPVSSAVEVEFAVGAMTLDGGNDLVKEDLDKKNSYKLFFDNLLQTLVEKGVGSREATRIAFAQTVNTYCNLERRNSTIKELERGQTGAEAWRDLGLEATNRVKAVNGLGLKLLKPLMPFFLIGLLLGIVGLGLSFVALPLVASVAISAVGALIVVGATGFKASSMYNQIKANKKQLGRANIALAIANAKKFDAQRERAVLIAKELTEIKGIVNNLGDNQKVRDIQEYREVAEKQKSSNTLKILSPKEARQRMLKEIDEINNEEIAIDGRVDGWIDRDKQVEYTMDLFFSQASRSKITSEIEYKKNINSWIQSASSRARLVIVEAEPEPENLKQLAKVTFNASPLERVLIVGLTQEKKKILTSELKELWKEKLGKSEENKAQFQQLYEGNGDWKDNLEQRKLEDLLGPHLYKDDLDISPKIMNEQFPHFDVNTEEILCFGKNDELAENLGELGQSIQTGVPIFSVKSKPFEELEGAGLWRSCCKDKDEFIKTIALGKSAPDLIGKKTEIGYKNITIADSFQELFDLKYLQNKVKNHELSDQKIQDVEQKDINYLKKILFEEALYPANTSPVAITKTISKSTSKLGALAGEKVADSLKWNLVGRPVSAAVEVNFAIASMTLDGGNDLIKEDLDKKNLYKSFFEEILNNLTKKGEDPKKATEKAFIETMNIYCSLEKENESIRELISGESGAEAWRDLGLKYTNKAKKAARIGVKALKPLMFFFIIGLLLAVVGLATPFIGVPLVASLALGVVGLVGTIGATAAIGASTAKLAKANRDLLPTANFAFAQANSKMYDAQQKHISEIAKQKGPIMERLAGRGTQITQRKKLHKVVGETSKKTESISGIAKQEGHSKKEPISSSSQINFSNEKEPVSSSSQINYSNEVVSEKSKNIEIKLEKLKKSSVSLEGKVKVKNSTKNSKQVNISTMSISTRL